MYVFKYIYTSISITNKHKLVRGLNKSRATRLHIELEAFRAHVHVFRLASTDGTNNRITTAESILQSKMIEQVYKYTVDYSHVLFSVVDLKICFPFTEIRVWWLTNERNTDTM